MYCEYIGYVFVIVTTSSITVFGQTPVLTSSCGGTVQSGASCILTCNTATEQTAVNWTDGNSTYVHERTPQCAVTSGSLPSGYNASCPTVTNFTLSIAQAQINRDEKTWSCQLYSGGASSDNVTITVTAEPPRKSNAGNIGGIIGGMTGAGVGVGVAIAAGVRHRKRRKCSMKQKQGQNTDAAAVNHGLESKKEAQYPC